MDSAAHNAFVHELKTEAAAPILQSVVTQLHNGLPLYKAADVVERLYGLTLSDEDQAGRCASYAAAAVRMFLSQRFGHPLTALTDTAIHPPLVKTEKGWKSKIPNYIGGGFGGRPVSVVGPTTLEIEVSGYGERLKEEGIYVPLAPTRFGVAEGVSAGLKYISESEKPIILTVEGVSRVTRSPIVDFSTEEEAKTAAGRIKAGVRSLNEPEEAGDMFNSIKARADILIAEHGGSLGGMKTVVVGRHLWANFVYEMSGDKYGHEAVTGITRNVVHDIILKEYPMASMRMLAGGLDGDLRPSTQNIRGRKVAASLEITEQMLSKRFGGISAEELHELNQLKQQGNIMLGTPTMAGMAPEILEALFYTLEPPTSPFVSSTVQMSTEIMGDGVLLKATLPNMEVGTVHEAPISEIARECRAIAGNIDGAGNPPGRNAIRMSARIGALTLAGELNQYCQMATGRLGGEAYRKC